MLQLPADEAQLEEAASSKIDVEGNGDVHMAELKKKRNPKEAVSQRKLAATGKTDEAQLEKAATSEINTENEEAQVAELKTKRNAKKANAAKNTHFDAKKKQKKKQAPALSMTTTAAVDEKETTEGTTIKSDNSDLVSLFADATTTILIKTSEATTKNSRVCIDEMTVSIIDKEDTRDDSLKHNNVLEIEVIIKIKNKLHITNIINIGKT